MSHTCVSHFAIVTATATVANDAVNLFVDVTYPSQQTPTLSDRHRCSDLRLWTSQKMASAPISQSASYWSAPVFNDPSFNLSSASTAAVSSADMTSMYNLPDSQYHSGHGSWYGNTEAGNNLYWPSDFLVNNGNDCQEYEQYDSNVIGSLGNVDGYSGAHSLHDGNYRNSSHWTTSNLDHASCSDAYREWNEQGGSMQRNRGSGFCQFKDISTANEKYCEEMGCSDYDQGHDINNYDAQQNLQNIYTDSPNFFTLSCAQSPSFSIRRTEQESSVGLQSICQVTNPFQENVCGPQWQNTNIQETYSPSACFSEIIDDRNVKELNGMNPEPLEQAKSDFSFELSNNTSHKEKREALKNATQNGRDMETSCDESRDVSEEISLHASDSNTSCSSNSLSVNQETLRHHQRDGMNMTVNDCHHHTPTFPAHRYSEPQSGQARNTEKPFFSGIRDGQHQTMQSNSPSTGFNQPLSQTFPRPVSPVGLTRSSLPESSSSAQPLSSSKATGLSPDGSKTPRHVQTHSPNTTSSSQQSVKAVEVPCKHGGPASPSEPSMSPLSSNAQSAIDVDQPVIDVDHLLSSGITVAGFKPRPIIRKRPKVMTPTAHKDGTYWHKRKKNNDSAKRSREAKKQKEKNFYRRALELEYENYFLKERLGQLEAQLHAVTGVVPGPPPPPPSGSVISPMPPLPPSAALPPPPPPPPQMNPVPLAGPLPPAMAPSGHSTAVPIADYVTSTTSAGPPCV